jgi:hypothetical protein
MPPIVEAEQPWESLQRTYEGFPLYLRRPKNLDFDALAPKFPVLLILTHVFSFRRFDGAPEPTYNDKLEEFDSAVVRYFVGSGTGQGVLVETFGGKRNYYFYTAATVNPTLMLSDLRGRFPGQNLEVESKSDPNWRFIRDYTNNYLNEA